MHRYAIFSGFEKLKSSSFFFFVNFKQQNYNSILISPFIVKIGLILCILLTVNLLFLTKIPNKILIFFYIIQSFALLDHIIPKDTTFSKISNLFQTILQYFSQLFLIKKNNENSFQNHIMDINDNTIKT